MSKLVTIYGGSGFVGRYIVRRMAKAGWRVRVAVRRPNEAMHVKPYGVPGQVEPVFCNIRNDESVAAVMAGADAVVNCVGVLNEVGKNTFSAVQAEGAGRIASIAAQNGVGKLVHVSAIGADSQAESVYAQSKARGEDLVLEAFPEAMILRPSVIFGAEDQFFNRFAAMTRFGPILPIAGGESRFQPVYVDDVAQAAVAGLTGEITPGVYELGGPEVKSFSALMQDMLAVIHRRRLVVSLPHVVARVMAWSFDLAQSISFGLFENTLLTRDQLKNLKNDNVVAEGAKGFAELGIEPVALVSVLPDYLWKFRPSGQYDELMRSARNIRGDV
ncbi:complex I NDUFA9 subunit family protein [Epibacterium sp. Ofav1-8]|uniref:complex I NDUFA9 subunit family protein n=1 Tax=Epibacterium sp. Ofav1-8 TaxID=2917735 RepID=UPI001EF699B6|nr:complex I NDUFA9 subunit family protein [Epibacterium sp. Ofav1-8]MCG7623715.1 complex I NDUFA9 subunit family protein [Epibacterium sp. Ofav1-8]